MPATREQLRARWETEEGRKLANDVKDAFNPTSQTSRILSPERKRTLTAEARIPLADELRQRLTTLPFVDEVAPQLDLRGVHTSRHDLFLIQVDVAGAHLEYATLSHIQESRLDGAILDGCQAINVDIQGNLSRVSLIDAILNGAHFLHQVNLTGAQLQGAHLVRAELWEAICTGANFLAADMRFSDCRRADFRGADLREVDFTEATLDDIRFDEQTRLRGADLRGAGMTEEFLQFAQRSGALLGLSHHAKDFALLDVAIKMLQESENPRVLEALPVVRNVRNELASDSQRDWGETLTEALSQAGYADLEDEIFDAWGDSWKAMGFYI